jgi:hypothetical protein
MYPDDVLGGGFEPRIRFRKPHRINVISTLAVGVNPISLGLAVYLSPQINIIYNLTAIYLAHAY